MTNYGQILTINSNGTASYNSLQAQFEKRFSHNFQAQTSFTWSKNIDVASTGNASFTGSVANPYDLRYNRGISDLNYPFVSVTNAVYTTPASRGTQWAGTRRTGRVGDLSDLHPAVRPCLWHQRRQWQQ